METVYLGNTLINDVMLGSQRMDDTLQNRNILIEYLVVAGGGAGGQGDDGGSGTQHGGGGGAGSGNADNATGGSGGPGGYGFYNKPITQPFAQPYSVAGPGPRRGSGGNTTIANVGTVNGGGGGNYAPGTANGNVGTTGTAPGATLGMYSPSSFFLASFPGTGGAGVAAPNPSAGVGGVGYLLVLENTGT